MIDWIKNALIGSDTTSKDRASGDTHNVRVAACALMLEIAHIDGEFSTEERARFTKLISKEFTLTEEQVKDLTAEAEEERQDSIDLWHFTNLINSNYSNDEKIHIVELLWKIVFMDGQVDKHEDYMTRKLGKLLELSAREIADAKVRVSQGLQ